MDILLSQSDSPSKQIILLEGEPAMPLEVWFVGWKWDNLTFDEQTAFIEMSGSIQLISFSTWEHLFLLWLWLFWDSLFVESVTKSYMFAPF